MEFKPVEKNHPTQNPLTQRVLVGPDPKKIQDLFGRNAHVYDRANDIISLGLAHSWRKQLVFWSGTKKDSSQNILDCATGTGDLAFAFQKASPASTVIGCDFCAPMLEKARKKAKKLSFPVDFQWADATQLPYSDNTFHITSMAYGLRNIKDPLKALLEMARVTQSQGKILILETGEVRGALMGTALRFYFKVLVPLLGGWVSGDRQAYEYLSHSSRNFPCGKSLKEFLESTMIFSDVQCRSILWGASFMYKCTVNEQPLRQISKP